MMQPLINSLITACILALPALGITMIFAVERFANSAHGSFITLGAYLTYNFSVIFGLHFIIAVFIACLVVGLLAVLLNEIIYSKLKPYGGLTLMVASFALALILDNLVRAIWGSDPRTYKIRLGQTFNIMNGSITLVQIIILIVTLLAMTGFYLLLVKTKIGKAWRAYSSNPNLALSCGIDIKFIVRWLWFICGAYAAIGGVMIAMDTHLEPLMGWNLLIPLFATCIVGGIGNPHGTVLGALVIGFSMNFILSLDFGKIIGCSWYIPTLYKYAVAFLVMIVVLIFRPMGILKGERGD